MFLNKAKKNIAYVHFPEIHHDYARGTFKRKLTFGYSSIGLSRASTSWTMVFCNSNYTKEAIHRYWKSHGVKDPIVVYPPVNLEKFWSDKPLVTEAKKSGLRGAVYSSEAT